ncbi:MAG: geranylgeranylglyceryl/heptaprenylglyceryl phosphate synthase [Bacteroidetes bacterium]|nr:geranylgeranylglyceryl/heptaprenylglyceryl phosphate synthase [Bacteroidota bacterium]
MIYRNIIEKAGKQRQFAILIDPDKQSRDSLIDIVCEASAKAVDFLLLGGSLISTPVDTYVQIIKEHCDLPVLLFPGSLLQISEHADAILLLSLISGRNPDFLVGNQVVAAPLLKKSGLEIIPTGYMLIDSGKLTSVEYMSNTKPIPADKLDIAVATSIAGEMLGNKLIYLEAGSGAPAPVPAEIVRKVRENISIPLIVGGGLRTSVEIRAVCDAGADIIVVGTAIERDHSLIEEFAKIIHS